MGRTCRVLFLAALALLGGLPARAQAVLPRVPDATVQASPDRPMVWVHSMTCFPLDLKWLPAGYGANAPLEQEQGLEERTGAGWAATDIQDAKAAGIDGFSVDVFTGNDRNYLVEADRVGGFLVAPCLDLSMVPDDRKEAEAVRVIEQNCRVAQGHPSAARVGAANVVFLYGTGMLAPEAWVRVRDKVRADGFPSYFVAAVEAGGDLSVAARFPAAVMARYLPPFEAAYSFGSTGPWWAETSALVRDAGKKWAGGMMPGYDRETPNGGYSDARATAAYREEWHRHLESGPAWACVSTWNDLAENTGLLPGSDWNVTRADLTRWFAAKFKKENVGWDRPRLYVTTPKMVYRGRPYPAEGLALNALARPVRVTTEIRDGAGRLVGVPVTVLVPPGSDGAATATVKLSAFPAGHFLRARATLRDGGGRVLASVLSAPILVLDEAAQPGYRTTYYSVPADKALSGAVRLTSSAAPSGRSVRVVPPPGAPVRFAEVLHNGALARNFFRTPGAVALPRRDAGGGTVGLTAWGFTMGRVTDGAFRVGYSDPVYTAPVGDVSLWESFKFDEGAGVLARDSSVHGKVGRLQDVLWATPGVGGAGTCVRFNGTTSRVLLDDARTPTGPFFLTLAVRPAKLGGFLYGDGGGLICALRPDGTLNFSLLTKEGWRPVAGKTALKIGEWAHLGFTNDGRTSRIFVNGRLDAEAPSGPLNDSGSPMIGGNPYGGDAYAGDLDDFTLRALPPSNESRHSNLPR